jgi:hypothetical protein
MRLQRWHVLLLLSGRRAPAPRVLRQPKGFRQGQRLLLKLVEAFNLQEIQWKLEFGGGLGFQAYGCKLQRNMPLFIGVLIPSHSAHRVLLIYSMKSK